MMELSKSAKRILIVEDNYSFAIHLEKNLLSWGLEVIGITEDSTNAIKIIKETLPDIILMDINIKGPINGIGVAERIKELNIPIIFITGLNNDITYNAAKKTTGISYLVKPFEMLTLKAAIEFYSFQSKITISPPKLAKNNTLLLRKGKELIPINYNSIFYLEADGNYVYVHTDNYRYVMRKSLKKIANELPADIFIQIHKKYIIPFSSINRIYLSDNIIIVAGNRLPIGRKYKNNLLEKFK